MVRRRRRRRCTGLFSAQDLAGNYVAPLPVCFCENGVRKGHWWLGAIRDRTRCFFSSISKVFAVSERIHKLTRD